jgi:hypothetical protein
MSLGQHTILIKNGFNVKDPDCPFNDLADLVSYYNAKPIYMQEIGYQTSGANNSSEYKQAEFYCNLFKAWDMHASLCKANIIKKIP